MTGYIIRGFETKYMHAPELSSLLSCDYLCMGILRHPIISV